MITNAQKKERLVALFEKMSEEQRADTLKNLARCWANTLRYNEAFAAELYDLLTLYDWSGVLDER